MTSGRLCSHLCAWALRCYLPLLSCTTTSAPSPLMQSSTTASFAPKIINKDIYHQIIPHCILRQFNFVPSDRLYVLKTILTRDSAKFLSANRSRERVKNHWRTQYVRGDQILIYDLATGLLQQKPVPREYGKANVFNDPKNTRNVMELEHQLAEFEGEAASVARAIHYSIKVDGDSPGSVTLSRKQLAILRKFIFVTHYRGHALHIQEANSTSGKTKPTTLPQSREAWLRGLEYYLDTPHYDIIATGERLRERYTIQLAEMLENRSYPDEEELAFQYALEYEGAANKYFLGVWIAAEESEFVLSGHTFSFWEGLIYDTPGAHRLHVLSPRIAIILRRTCLHHPRYNQPSVLYSSLADIPISPPNIRYADQDLSDILEANPDQETVIMNDYRTTAKAEDDSFTYPFTRLSAQQTYAVNEVIMMHTNLQREGSVIFRDRNVMQQTLDSYMSSPHTFLGGKQRLYRPLALQLAMSGFHVESERGRAHSSFDEDESASDCQLNLLLGSMIQKHVTFPSAYTRAFIVFHMTTMASSTNPIYITMRTIRDAAVDKLPFVLDPPLPGECELRTDSTPELVRSLTSEDSDVFFSLITPLLDQTNVGIRRSNNFLTTVINEAAIIGVTYWLVAERPDVLRDILLPWVKIWV